MGGLMTRFMAIFTVIAIAILARREADVADKHDEEKKLLNSVVEKRTNGLKQVVDQFDEVKIRLSEAEQLGALWILGILPFKSADDLVQRGCSTFTGTLYLRRLRPFRSFST